MTRDIYAVAPDTSIETAARLMAAGHFTGAPVIDRHGRPIGVVSLSDLANPDLPRSDGEGYPRFYFVGDGVTLTLGDDVTASGGRVADVMSPFVLAIEAGASLQEAAIRMMAERVHRLLVMEASQLVGIVTSMDLLRGFVSER